MKIEFCAREGKLSGEVQFNVWINAIEKRLAGICVENARRRGIRCPSLTVYDVAGTVIPINDNV